MEEQEVGKVRIEGVDGSDNGPVGAKARDDRLRGRYLYEYIDK